MGVGTHVAWCAASTAVGALVNHGCEAFGPASWKRDIMGTPWFSWRIGSLHQALVFLPCLFLSMRAWFASGWKMPRESRWRCFASYLARSRLSVMRGSEGRGPPYTVSSGRCDIPRR